MAAWWCLGGGGGQAPVARAHVAALPNPRPCARTPVPTATANGKRNPQNTQNANTDSNHANQALSAEDIEELKRSGKAGADIIEALCSNSATFDTKTEFAQDKYKKRKSRKYVTRVTLRRPTGRALCEAVFEKTAPAGQRIWNLRPDSLAAALALANVGANSRVLVIESCQGLVAAAAAERLGGRGGAVVCAAAGDKGAAPVDCVRMMNLSGAARAAVHTTTLAALLEARRRADAAAPGAAAAVEGGAPQAAGAAASSEQQQRQQQQAVTDEDMADFEAELYGACGAAAGAANGVGAVAAVVAAGAVVEEQQQPEQQQQQQSEQQQQQQQQQQDAGQQPEQPQQEGEQPGEQEQQPQRARHSYTVTPAQLDSLVRPGFTSCLLAAPRLHAASLIRKVLPLLAPCAAFCAFSPWPQPLAEAMAELTKSGDAAMVSLSESWLREYQVLPGRTHPTMGTNGTGGYLLSGVKIIRAAAADAARAGGGGGGRGGGRGGGGRGGRGGGRGRGGKRPRN